MSQNSDIERQKTLQAFEVLVNSYYIADGKQRALYEDFKTSAINLINEVLLENQSLKAHLKALQDEKTSDNTNIEHDLKEK